MPMRRVWSAHARILLYVLCKQEVGRPSCLVRLSLFAAKQSVDLTP